MQDLDAGTLFPPVPAASAGTPVSGIALKTYLTRLLWLCVLPLFVLAAWLAYDSVRTLRARQTQEAAQLARGTATSVDQYLRSRTQALNMLAISPLMDQPAQWPLLYQQAQSFHASFDGHVILADMGSPMPMLFNTRSPYGATLPPLPVPKGHAAAPAAVQTRQPAVGDSFVGPVARTPLVAMAVPVLRDGHVVKVVLATFEIGQFQARLDQLALPDGWALTLRDGRGDVIARRAPVGFDAARDVAAEGRFSQALAAAPWTVQVEVPRSAQHAPLWASGALLLLGLVIATLAGVLGGLIASRRLGRAVASLAQPAAARALIDIQEIRSVRQLLDDTAARQQASEARFRHLFQDAPAAMCLTSRDGTILAQNERFGLLFGYPPSELPTIEAWWQKAYPAAAGRDRAQADWNAMLTRTGAASGDVQVGEYRITCQNGESRIAEVHASALADGILCTYLDVTERRRAEERLKLWAESFEQAQLGQAISDASSNTIIAVNPTFAQERGFTREEMTGMPLGQLFAPGQGDVLQRVGATIGANAHANFECEHRRKDGSRFPVLLDITVLRDANGQIVNRVVYALDLTERKRAEAEVQQLNATLERRVVERTAELSAANRELDSFAYTVSHDLRAPLRALDGYSQLLLLEHSAQLDDSGRHFLNQITAASHRMGGLIEGILRLSRSVRAELQIGSVDLSALVALRLRELAQNEPGRQVTTEVQPGLLVQADPRMMDMVIGNLVDNAWKYTGKTAAAAIRFFSRTEDGQTWYCISDNGAGFDPTHARLLFQPFQRLHRHDEFPGIGIGLATVQRIVQRHGGVITAEGAVGQGATFCFTLARLNRDDPDR